MTTTVPETPDVPIVDPDALVETVNPEGSELVNWLIAIALVVGGILLAAAARRAIGRLLGRTQADTAHVETLAGRLVQAVIILLALVYALGAVGVRISPLLGALGIGGIALALAVQPALLNLFSGMIIHAQRPLRIGEEIKTGDTQGRVLDVTSRAVIIRTYDGETVYIPNAVVVDREIVNYVRLGRRPLHAGRRGGLRHRHRPGPGGDPGGRDVLRRRAAQPRRAGVRPGVRRLEHQLRRRRLAPTR